MALHPSLRQYGFGSDDEPWIRAFQSVAKDNGWSGDQIEQAYKWYQDNHMRWSSDVDVFNSFVVFSDQVGLGAEQELSVTDWMVNSAENGPEQPPDPTRAEDQDREREIRDLMASDPDAYQRDVNAQRDLHNIIERQGLYDEDSSQPPRTPLSGSSAENEGEPPAAIHASSLRARAARKDEIRSIMKTDIHRYYGEKLDVEFGEILKAEGGFSSDKPNDPDGGNDASDFNKEEI